MKKVLITGGAGFIGSHLGTYFADKGYQVELVDNWARGVEDDFIKRLIQKPNVTVKTVDLLEPGAVEKLSRDYHYIFHFAAILGVSKVLNQPYQVLQNNLLMLFHMISFAKEQSQLERFVFASTSEVYAGTLAHFKLPIPTPETTPIALTDLSHPRTSYMLSKLYGEALIQQSELPFTIIRPHNIYGPRMGLSHVIPELLKKAHESQGELEVFSVDHKRTFCYIDDAVRLVYGVTTNKAGENEVFNIGTQDPEITIGDLAKQIINTVQKDLKVIAKPPTAGSPARRCPNIEKAVKAAGESPSVSLSEGIKRTYEWYKHHVFSGKGPSAI
ncbi:NAD-dependent epimerase/dehydratase family protein [Halobacillus salinus]|uniref:NAD(P)-dependent oxidoreductase n=1 Tax=Halobacillus salinus TaxID=192814 RepID=A0A4Z0H1I5_9BACI|nr:NAD(P)-dependent oxidoreductase [Halobacillus salinus]TGB02731.1 NAD(P)-dependent oxidoreductase [Halobacillus salinus]